MRILVGCSDGVVVEFFIVPEGESISEKAVAAFLATIGT
jgi:hypothetical protein